MKIRFLLVSLFCLFIFDTNNGQKIYSTIGGEFIFSFSNVKFTESFKTQYTNAEVTKTDMRFTCFFHIGQYWHMDFGKNVGMFSGLGIRNIGLISDEKLPLYTDALQTIDYKICRRVYTLGIPIAIKLGALQDNFYFYGGGECEMAFAYKQKYWSNTQSRSGSITKTTQWFGNQTQLFLPSAFAGIQMPHGINIRFRYYLTDFLNHDYKTGNNEVQGANYDISDLSRYAKSEVYYISLCWQFRTYKIIQNEHPTNTQIALK
jgi:hypothetical protein